MRVPYVVGRLRQSLRSTRPAISGIGRAALGAHTKPVRRASDRVRPSQLDLIPSSAPRADTRRVVARAVGHVHMVLGLSLVSVAPPCSRSDSLSVGS